MAYRKIPSAAERKAPEDVVLEAGADLLGVVKAAAGVMAVALVREIGDRLPVTGAGFDDLERRLTRCAQAAVIAPVLAAVLKAVHEDSGFVWACIEKARALRGLRPAGKSSVEVRLLCGETVTVNTPYALQPPPKRPGPKRRPGRSGVGGLGCSPVLAQLGIVDNATSAVRSEVAWASAALGSFTDAQEALARRGLDLHVNTIRLLAQRVADVGLVDRQDVAAQAPNEPLAGKRVVVAIDGGRLRLRQNKRGRPRQSGWHGYDTPWREPKLMAVYTVDDNGRRDGDYLWYEGTLEGYDEAFALFVQCLRRLGIARAREVAFAADGSEHIWSRVPAALTALGLDAARVRTFVDFWHAVQHLHDASKLVRGLTAYEATLRATTWRKRLKEGRAAEIADELDLASERLRGEPRRLLHNHATYLRSNAERMCYLDLAAAKLPRGTGVVESAIRRVINLRLKGAGTFWHDEHAERMLLLRCRLKAGRWSELEAAMHRHAFSSRGNALREQRATARPPAQATQDELLGR
jgi:hypothetical protein